jgi:pimeloyl-ACP methyl ester carboxylesterase
VRTADFECWNHDDCFADPWEESEIVLIQHGCGRNSEHWRSWVPELGTRFRVLRRDTRAHGRSTAGRPDFPWTERAMAEDVVAFLEAMSIRRVPYVGESLGGVTGIAMGAFYPDYLHTLTLVQTPIHLGQRLNDYCRGEFSAASFRPGRMPCEPWDREAGSPPNWLQMIGTVDGSASSGMLGTPTPWFDWPTPP